MKLIPNVPPREFNAGGLAKPIVIKDCGRIELAPDEQVTFLGSSGAEYDVARKPWGFYATPSLNGRLKQFGLRPALVKSPSGKYYVFLRESGKEKEFHDYIASEQLEVVCWLDDEEALADIGRIGARGRAR